MTERKVSFEREAAIVRLLDDESPTVEAAVFRELRRLDDIGLTLIRKVLTGEDSSLHARARTYLSRLEGPDPTEAFLRFVRSSKHDLERGAILLNRVASPNVDSESVRRQLDAIAHRCVEAFGANSPVWERCKVINRVLFHEYGFRGNTEQFDDPGNTFIEQVLRRRKGIPISLSILYLLVARRCGVELEPIGMPGRFMVGCFHGETPFYVDPFERGSFRSVEELWEIMRSNNITPQDSYLSPTSDGEVLCRCCRNLVRQFTLKNNPRKAKTFATFVRAFDVAWRGFPHT